MISQYPKYKNTDTDLLRDIPEKWELKRLKFLLLNKLTYGANEVAESEDITLPRYIRITDFGDDGVLRSDTFKSLSVENAEDYMLAEGDILFARSGATVGKTFQFKNYTGVACFAGYLIKASVNEKKILSDFLYYFTKSNIYESWKDSIFVQATIQNIGADKYANLFVPIPSIKEQEYIVNFLDKKTSEIDTLISNKEKLIELLKEERTAIINKAVTKGINPKVKIKDSGVELLGEIPEHWEVKKLKFVLNVNENVISEKTDKEFIIKYIDIGNVSYGGLIKPPEEIMFGEAPSRARRITKRGDTILSTVRTYLKAISYIEDDFNNLISSTGFAVITPTNKFAPKYVFYLLSCHLNIEFISYLSKGVSYPAIDSFDLSNIKIALPPISEQNEILDYLENETDKIYKAITTIEKEIELIKEYRTALISEAVTGKIDLRGEING